MNDTSLEILAAQINQHVDLLEHAGPHYADDWLKANIKRSIRDCQKAMALAHTPDPRRELADQGEKNRQEVRRYRLRLRELVL
jgi:hypothetical protein